MSELFTTQAIVALISLTAIEIVLGIDNVIFIAILSEKLPESQRKRARTIGLLLAMVQRILLLLVIKWVMHLDQIILLDWGTLLHLDTLSPPTPAALPEAADALASTVAQGEGAHGAPDGAAEALQAHEEKDQRLSIKELIFLLGGLFLIAKATTEIHDKLEGDPEAHQRAKKGSTLGVVLFQILILDLVFSIDSVLTAVGLTNVVSIMIIAVVLSVIVMIVFSGAISAFVRTHPTIKMLALGILIMIGVLLVAEGLEYHLPRGYVYFAMIFALVVELLNIKAKSAKAAKTAKSVNPVKTTP